MKITVEFDPKDQKSVMTGVTNFLSQLAAANEVQGVLFTEDDPLKYMKRNNRKFLLELKKEYGNDWFDVKTPEVKKLGHKLEVSYVPDFFHDMAKRGLMELTRSLSNRVTGARIINF